MTAIDEGSLAKEVRSESSLRACLPYGNLCDRRYRTAERKNPALREETYLDIYIPQLADPGARCLQWKRSLDLHRYEPKRWRWQWHEL